MTRQTSPTPLIPIPRQGIPGLPGVILHLLVALAAVVPPLGLAFFFEGGTYLPTAAVEGISIAALLLICMYLLRTVKAARGILVMVLLSAFFISVAIGSVIPTAVVISLWFVTSEGALLVATADKRGLAILPLLPLAAFALSAALCGHLHGGVLSLLPFPIAVALGLGTRSSAAKENGLTRVGVICTATLVAGLSALAIGLYFLYLYMGTLDFAVLVPEFEAFRETLVTLLAQKAADAGGAVAELMTLEYITQLFDALVNLLPGYIVAVLLIFSALSHMLLLSGLYACGYGDSVTDRVRMYRISFISCLVFLVAYLILFVTLAEESSMAAAVIQNLIIILQPGLALGGLLRLVAFLSRRGARGGCAPFLLFIVPVLLFIAPTFLAAYAAIAGVLDPIRARLSPPTQPPEGNGGQDPHRSDNDHPPADP